MKKYLIILSISFTLFINHASADALKSSLLNMLNEKDTTSMVNLSNLDIDAKPKPVKRVKKARSSKAVIAMINSHKILKKEADAYLKKRTQGKMSNFDYLPKKQRLRLIQEMALPILIGESAQKELSSEEKEVVTTRLWMQKEVTKVKMTDEKVKKVYDQLHQQSKENNSTRDIPTFESVKDKIKMQLIEKQIIGNLMKNSEVKVW